MAQGVIPAPQATPQITGQLRREVGLTALMFISLGSIIGSGWLLGALLAAQIAGPASLVSWILGGAIIALLALIHAELGAAYPMAGGTARFPHLVFGSIPGFTAGWAAWLQAVTIAPIEVEAALSYLNNKAPGLVKADMTLTGEGLLVSAALMFAFTVLNILGVRWLAESNKITVIWKTAIPVLTVIVLLVVSFHVSNFTAGGGFAPFGVHGIFAALPAGIVFAVQGFEQAIQMGGEAKNPARDMPRAVIGAMVIGTVIYLFLELAFIGALNPNNLVHGWGGIDRPQGRLRSLRHDRHRPGSRLARRPPLHRRVHLPGRHRPRLPGNIVPTLVRPGAQRLPARGRRQGEQARGALGVDPAGVWRRPDRLPALPELAEPGRTGDVGHGHHVCLRPGVSGRAAEVGPGS